MSVLVVLVTSLLAATTVSIVEPMDGETYDGDWLPLRAIVENDNELPDSVTYNLNGSSSYLIPRLSTDWPTYMRDYLRNGYSDSPAPHTSDVLWTAPICGDYHEFPTPAVVNGTVYYPQDGCGDGDTLYAINAATGEIAWTRRVGYTDDTVTYSEGLIYCASDSFFCIDSESGTAVWSFCPEDGLWATGSPIVTDGTAYHVTASYDTTIVHASDALSGAAIWVRGLTGRMESSLAYEDGVLFIALYGSGLPPGTPTLLALNTSDGSTVWSNDHVEDGYWDSSPCIHWNHIYIGGSDGCLHAFDKSSGELVWETLLHPTLNWIEPTPAYHNDQVFIGCANYQLKGYVGALSGSSGLEIWNYVDEIPLHGSFGLAEDLAFMGAMGVDSVYAFDQSTGDVIWSFGFLGEGGGQDYDGCQSSPSITDGVMYIPATDGNLYAFGTGLKYTYREDYFYTDVGSNQLIVTSWEDGSAIASDTISFTVTQTGITLQPTTQFNLHAAPNPISVNTSISFTLASPGFVSLRLYDLAGREVSTPVHQYFTSGGQSVQWSGCGDDGEPLSSGLYLCRIEKSGVVETTGLCVLR